VARCARRAQRGVAFVLVLWVIALVTILLGSFALIARTENLQARHLFDSVRARYAAEAGLNRAVYELRNPDPQLRWTGDGRPYEFEFEGARVSVSLTDESGKVDINVADATMLKALFVGSGVEEARAEALADAIVDWRDPDDMTSPHGAEEPEYRAAGLPYKPKNGPFDTVGEVQQVLGMDYATFQRIEPAVTLYSGSGQPNPGFAPIEVLRALPGVSEELARSIVAQRQAVPPGQPTGLTLPDGTPVMAGGGGLTYSIQSRATLPGGASTLLDATIRLGGANPAGRPFVILRWRDGENS